MMTRRDFTAAAAAATGTALMTGTGLAKTANGVRIEGPVTGGTRGHIFGGYLGDALTAHDYVEEEYFVSGVATNYVAEGTLTKDGRWATKPGTRAPYKTRVIVHRPRNPANFNGIVICEWTNVSAGLEISSAVNQPFFKSGFAYAAISAQTVGIEGFPPGSGVGLVDWDKERYGSLRIPGDSYSYDIFTQVARALGNGTGRTGPDPLGGLAVRRRVALGESQSATRLAAYINAAHPHAKMFDGFLVVVHVGGATELEDFVFDPNQSLGDNNNRRRAQLKDSLIRDDLPTPILVLNSETEVAYFRGAKQPDSKWLRVWEVAGSVHASAVDTGYRGDISQRDGIKPMTSLKDAKMVRFMPTIEAAAAGIARWVEGGAPLPRQPRLLVGTDGRTILRDRHGNALGGVRLPEIAVPTAGFDTANPPARGTRTPFSADELARLYPSTESYVNMVTAAAQRCEVQDVILPYRTAEYIEEAKKGPAAAG